MHGKYVGKRDQPNIKNAKKNIYSLSKTVAFLIDNEV